jgi:hypothetical protein
MPFQNVSRLRNFDQIANGEWRWRIPTQFSPFLPALASGQYKFYEKHKTIEIRGNTNIHSPNCISFSLE